MMAAWSQISVSQLVGALRLDAEFWHPSYIRRENAIRQSRHAPLGTLVTTFRKGIFYLPAKEYADAGIPFYRSSNVGNILPNEAGLAYITEEKHDSERKTALHPGDLMMVKTGRAGASVVFSSRCNVSQDVIAVKVRADRVNPYYLSVYLNTAYGYSEMQRWFQGQVQPHLSLKDARNLWVSIPDMKVQERIAGLVKQAASFRTKAKTSYDEAQSCLEFELGLEKLPFNDPIHYVAQFRQVLTSHRMDAAYYHLRYAQLIQHLKTGQWIELGRLAEKNCRGVQPVYVDNGEVDVVNSQHLGPHHLDYGALSKTTQAAFMATPEAQIRYGDILIYATGAYVGRANVYLRHNRALASNHVHIVRLSNHTDPAYMAIVLSSPVGTFQTEKHARGSAQAELYPSDIAQFVVPLIEPEKQQAIGDLVRESLAAQDASLRLLEQAKHCVEALIENPVGPNRKQGTVLLPALNDDVSTPQ